MIYDTYIEVAQFQSDHDHPSHLKELVAEALNAGVLDSGATKTDIDIVQHLTYIDIDIVQYLTQQSDTV